MSQLKMTEMLQWKRNMSSLSSMFIFQQTSSFCARICRSKKPELCDSALSCK